MPSPIFKSKNMDRLDTHENFPAGFREYLENYGWHFSKKMCEFAVSRMKDRNGKKIEPYSKDKVDALLKQYGIELKRTRAMTACTSATWHWRTISGRRYPIHNTWRCSYVTISMTRTATTACHLHVTMPIPSAREHPSCGKR